MCVCFPLSIFVVMRLLFSLFAVVRRPLSSKSVILHVTRSSGLMTFGLLAGPPGSQARGRECEPGAFFSLVHNHPRCSDLFAVRC